MTIRQDWQPYDTDRTDCIVYVKRWGDGLMWRGAAWRAIHQPTQITADVTFDPLVPDGQALAQLFWVLDYRLHERPTTTGKPSRYASPPSQAIESARPLAQKHRGARIAGFPAR